MAIGRDESGSIRPTSLSASAAHEWRHLSLDIIRARRTGSWSGTNVTLGAAAEREPQSPASPAYRLWVADNFARDGLYADAITAYETVVSSAQSASRLFAANDPIATALFEKAQALALTGNAIAAIATFRELWTHAPNDATPLLRAGLLAEEHGQAADAADLYRAIASRTPSSASDDPSELARRALLRLEDTATSYAPDPDQLRDTIATTLLRRDTAALERLVSRTHFAIGPAGGHTGFEDLTLLDELLRDLGNSRIKAKQDLLGTGAKRYLMTSGWRGTWFRGSVTFILSRAPAGWQWTGLGLGSPTQKWFERWTPDIKQTNAPLPFDIPAPWPAGQSFMAGGLAQFIIQQAFLLANLAGGWVGAIVAAATAEYWSASRCGFGPRGFYYNTGPTHDQSNAFAIDFTRYRRYVPYDNISGGTPVLAVREGIVRTVRASIPSGDASTENRVEIEHDNPVNPADGPRFTSRYLHMEGPYRIPVSEQMFVPTGTRLGLMDDTGNSVLNHLHFSIHDKQIMKPNYPSFGGSVRPTPMSGVTLGDNDSGRCVLSTNVEFNGGPMKEVTQFDGQNWLITPAALARNETPPLRIEDQKFLVVLSGVAVIDIKGNSGSQWFYETVLIRPDIVAALQYAVTKHGLHIPPGNFSYRAGLQVEQWVPYAALGSVFNQNQSINSGHAVERWRPNPFVSFKDFSNATVSNIFDGIQVDVAVRDTDAWLYRLSYNVTLLGKIILGPQIIT